VVAFARDHQVGVRLKRMLSALDTIVGGTVPRWVLDELHELRVWPVERCERVMMNSEPSSLAMAVTKSVVVQLAAERTATMATLCIRLLRGYRESWQVPWFRMPAAAAARLLRRVRRR